MNRVIAAILTSLVLPLPALAQDMEEAEFNFVMIMQFNGCSMTEADLEAVMLTTGIDQATYETVAAAFLARGDATVTVGADGANRISMAEWACEPVDFSGEWEVGEPESPEAGLARYREEIYVTIMASNTCTMTEAEIAAVMPDHGLRQPLHEALTQDLVGRGAATLTAEADGSQRVTLGPDICTPGVQVTTLIPAKPESVVKFTDLLLTRDCTVGIEQLETVEAELGLEMGESYPITIVMEVAGEGQMDFENGVFRLINKDCP